MFLNFKPFQVYADSVRIVGEILTAAKTLDASDSGKTFYLNSATEFAVTLPAPADGLYFKFVVKAAPSGASYTVVSASGTDNIHGNVVSAEDALGSGDSTSGTAADTITFVDSKAQIGDFVEVVSDGTLWYALAVATQQDAITYTAS